MSAHPCLDDETLLDAAEGRRRLDPLAEAHLAHCSDCRRLLAAAARGASGTLRDPPARPDDEACGEPSWEELGQGVVIDGRYELERFLGAGAMGVVWAARRLGPAGDGGGRTKVAIKVARSLDDELRRRFEREGGIATTLRHPHIARILEVIAATLARGPCLVQELIEGESLEAVLCREGALSLQRAARVVLPIADALSAAHAQGIVHRDLKPQNVLLEGERVVVIDFGIAKLLPDWGHHSKLTRTGAVLGTPRTMAPEQVFGEPDVDARADVWALGSMLFRILSGRAPIEANTVGDVMRALRAGTMLDLADLVPGLPSEVLNLVRAALVIPREARLADVRRFGHVLSRSV
jgi:serine/threonine-protein kinase